MNIYSKRSREESGKIKDMSVYEKSMTRFIKKHCGQILDIYRSTNKFLYRGMAHIDRDILLGKTPINRPSVDTPNGVHRQLNHVLRCAGFKALRSNCIFCTSERSCTKMYGNPYIIFPVDGFSYMWCKDSRDFLTTFHLIPTNNL